MSPIPNGYMWFGSKTFRAKILNPNLGHPDQIHEKNRKPVRNFSHAYEIEFVGGEAKSITESGIKSPTVFNFYLSKNQKEWCSGARAFEEIHYKEMYPGVDIRLYHQTGHLKYDLILNNAKDIEQVKIKYNGLEGIQLKNGNLWLKTSVGNIEESIPRAWQIVNGRKLFIDCRYRLDRNSVRFYFPKGYLPGLPLVVDPQIVFYTYSGSSADNWGNTATGDASGNSYLAGTVYGPGFPQSLGAYDPTYNGTQPYISSYDVGIQKFNPDGSILLASTYLGGEESDSPHSINLDKDENLIIMGSTSSLNFPVTPGAFQPAFGGGISFYPVYINYLYRNGSDIFVSKLKSDGTQLLGSTYLGGALNDGVMNRDENLYMNYGDAFRGDIALAPDGSILIASCSKSPNFPRLQAAQGQNHGMMDGVISRLSSNLDALIWSTYLGGANMDALYSIQMQGDTRVVVCGGSKSPDFPVSAGAFQTQITGQNNQRNSFCDAVVASYDLNSGARLHSTFSGTSVYDQAYLVQSDPAGNVYIFGQTQGTMPKTTGTFGQNDGKVFLQKFNPDLNTLIWATTIGNGVNAVLVPSAFLVDTCGRIYFSGWGGASNGLGPGYANGNTDGFPVTPDAIKSFTDGADFYICVLGSNAESLEYATFFGGNARPEHVDGGMSRFDKSGIITQAVCGCRSGNSFYQGTPGSYSPSINSDNCNQGVVKIDLGVLKAAFDITTEIGCGNTVTFKNKSTNGRNYIWYFGDGDTLASNLSTVTHIFPGPGTYIIRLNAINNSTCKKSDVYVDTITIYNPFNFPSDTTLGYFCNGDVLTPVLATQTGVVSKWLTTKDIINNDFINPIIKPTSPTFYTIENKSENGCIIYTYYQTIAKSDLVLEIGDSLALRPCEARATLWLKGKPSDSDFYHWTVANQKMEGSFLSIPILQPGNYPVQLNGQKNTCPDSVAKTIEVVPFDFVLNPEFSFETIHESCSDQYVRFSNQSDHVESYLWNFGDGASSTEKSPVHSYAAKGIYEVSLLLKNLNCESKNLIPVVFEPLFIPSLITSNEDDRNETFQIRGLGQGTQLEVFNRWGEKVFSASDYRNDWLPVGLNPGIYFFQLRFPGGKGCNSWLDVVR